MIEKTDLINILQSALSHLNVLLDEAAIAEKSPGTD